MDKIDPLYYVRSSRIDLKEETRIKATSEEVQTWEDSVKEIDGIFNTFANILSQLHIQLLRRISFPTSSSSPLR